MRNRTALRRARHLVGAVVALGLLVAACGDPGGGAASTDRGDAEPALQSGSALGDNPTEAPDADADADTEPSASDEIDRSRAGGDTAASGSGSDGDGAATPEPDPVTEADLARFVAASEAAVVNTSVEGTVLDAPDIYIAIAQASCARFSEGATLEDVVAEHLDGELSTSQDERELIGAVLGAAVETICPEHTEKI